MAGHSHFSPANVEEHFEFSAEGKKRIIYAFIAGLAALAVSYTHLTLPTICSV